MSTIDDDIDFLMNNLQAIAHILDGNFRDPSVRPKSDREKFEETTAMQAMTDGLAEWRGQSPELKNKHLNGLRGFAMQALSGEFAEQRARWIYSRLVTLPDLENERRDAEKKARMRELRTAQASMKHTDNAYRCLACGMFVYHRDRNNNKIHEQEDVCSCGGTKSLQRARDEEISAYRKGLDDRKKRAADKARRKGR